jgi:hypothetical protein
VPVIVRVARPFTLHHGARPHFRHGIGVYLMDDAHAGHHYVLHHLQEAVVARGEALVQHRPPSLSWFPGSVWYRGLSIVQNIEPMGQPLIWRWPPTMGNATEFPWHAGVVEPAPDAMVAVRAPHVGADGVGEWRRELRVVTRMTIPPGYYWGHGTPRAVPESSLFPWNNPSFGDTIVFGEMPSVPFVLDIPPAPPRPDPIQAGLLARQAEAVSQGERGTLLAEATRAAARIPYRLPGRAVGDRG